MNSKLDFCKTTLVWIQEIMFSNIVLVVHINHVHVPVLVFIQGTSGCTLYSQTWEVPCKYNSTTCTSWTRMPNIANVNKVQYTLENIKHACSWWKEIQKLHLPLEQAAVISTYKSKSLRNLPEIIFFDTRGTLELCDIRWLPYSLEFSSFQFFDKCNCPCLNSLNENQTSISNLGI